LFHPLDNKFSPEIDARLELFLTNGNDTSGKFRPFIATHRKMPNIDNWDTPAIKTAQNRIHGAKQIPLLAK